MSEKGLTIYRIKKEKQKEKQKTKTKKKSKNRSTTHPSHSSQLGMVTAGRDEAGTKGRRLCLEKIYRTQFD